MYKLKKIIEIQAARKPALVMMALKEVNTTRASEESVLKISKCLFGKCDPDDTLRMLQEQVEMDKIRFMERFGIDIDRMEEEETENVNPNIVKKPSENSLQKPLANRKRKMLCGKGNKRITEFYKMKKPRLQDKENKTS
ncbi:uncharacterized protein LOC123685009 [Harmonia axyridis]|uniref:uncharacterized protein LOC123685009 n=1 Tax=Harmonia axyridis TaxID=115357 RepID=UPI001E27683A|nr:uncharacterized protein LOC123685009 [Harmonia axyridis]